jgi:hypothetical protein
MHFMSRKTAPGVRHGDVQRKNNWRETEPRGAFIVRERPGAGYRHVLTVADVETFLDLLPEREAMCRGLHTVLLARAAYGADGWHVPGVVAVCAWSRELWIEPTDHWLREHRELLERLGVERSSDGRLELSLSQIRAYQLLHVLLHELGHHHDAMTTRSGRAGRGEPYAEGYAWHYERLIWTRYVERFGWPNPLD